MSLKPDLEFIALYFKHHKEGKIMKDTFQRFVWQFKIGKWVNQVQLIIQPLTGHRKVKLNDQFVHEERNILCTKNIKVYVNSEELEIIYLGDRYDMKVRNQLFSTLLQQKIQREQMGYGIEDMKQVYKPTDKSKATYIEHNTPQASRVQGYSSEDNWQRDTNNNNSGFNNQGMQQQQNNNWSFQNQNQDNYSSANDWGNNNNQGNQGQTGGGAFDDFLSASSKIGNYQAPQVQGNANKPNVWDNPINNGNQQQNQWSSSQQWGDQERDQNQRNNGFGNQGQGQDRYDQMFQTSTAFQDQRNVNSNLQYNNSIQDSGDQPGNNNNPNYDNQGYVPKQIATLNQVSGKDFWGTIDQQQVKPSQQQRPDNIWGNSNQQGSSNGGGPPVSNQAPVDLFEFEMPKQQVKTDNNDHADLI